MTTLCRLDSRITKPLLVCLFSLVLWHAPALRADDVAFPDLDKSGESLIAKGELAKAESLYRDAIEQARQKGDRPWTAEFLRRMGEVHERTHDWKVALDWYDQSLEIRRALGQKPEIARLLVGTGWVKLRLNDIPGAAERLSSGRDLYHDLGDALNEANAIGPLAQIAAYRGEFEKADEQYRSQLALYEDRHVPAGIVNTRLSHARSYFQRSQYRNALSEAFAAIEAAAAAAKDLPAGDERRDLLTNQANAMETVGNTYQRMVQLPRALDYYQQALGIRQDLHDDEGTAFAWSNMAPVMINLGKISEAVSALERALAVRRAIGNPANIATTLIALGEASLAQGKPEEARQRYQEALTLATAGSASQAVALYQLGNISLEAGRLDDALSFHQRALSIREKTRNPHDVVRSSIQIANVNERRGELAEAEAAYAKALSGFEKLSIEISDPVQLASFRETAALLYPGYSRVLVKESKFNDALLIAERGRGQALARMSGTGRPGFLALLTPEERAKWNDAAGALAKSANRFRIAIEQGAPDPQRADANAVWLDARLALTRTREHIFTENPQLQSKEPPDRPDLQPLLDLSRRNPRTLYLEWLAVDNGSTLLFSLSSGETKAFLLPSGIDQLRKLVADWRSTLVRGEGRGFTIVAASGSSSQPEPDLARGLYRAALGPMAASLEAGTWDRIVAVTDGPLLDAPLAALAANNGQRLIERFAISSAVSLHSLAAQAETRAASASLLVVGDPSEKGKERVVIPSGSRLAPLAQARAEAKAIASEFPGAIDLTGAEARESQVKRRLDCCSILHFATHGILDSNDGMESGLLLAAEPEDSAEDGMLQAWEIAEMRLNAKLAVLSACDSARGDRSLGEGLVGLAWAFQAAGTPAVVASLWSVDDAATADLMRAFYAALKQGARTDDALQRAMRQLQRQKSTSAPYFWAAFSLMGESRAIE